MAVVAQFLYVAAQAGIFSFFINYMTSQVPEIPPSLDAAIQQHPGFLQHWINSLTEIRTTGAIAFNNKGASNLVSVGLLLFLGGRFIGTALLRKFAADKLLGLYGAINTVLCLLIFLKLGWFSGLCVFGTYFFMSIMFPTIFALGIFGLGQRAKRASSFLVNGRGDSTKGDGSYRRYVRSLSCTYRADGVLWVYRGLCVFVAET